MYFVCFFFTSNLLFIISIGLIKLQFAEIYTFSSLQQYNSIDPQGGWSNPNHAPSYPGYPPSGGATAGGFAPPPSKS